jgi:hypothetical protein
MTGRNIVGISPGARYLGIVGVDGQRVSFRNILGRRHASSLRLRLRRTLEELQPDLVVLEIPGHRRLTPDNVAVERLVVRVLVELGVPTVRERLTVARKGVLGGGVVTRSSVHRTLAERFPRLQRLTNARKGVRWWSDVDRYWERAFGALTLALWAELSPGLVASAGKAGPDLPAGDTTDEAPLGGGTMSASARGGTFMNNGLSPRRGAPRAFGAGAAARGGAPLAHADETPRRPRARPRPSG